LKKAFQRLNISHPMLEPDQMQQYSYNILSYIAKVKHMAREEFDSLCCTVAAALQHSTAPIFPLLQIGVPRLLIAPSIQFRNPFEVKRSKLIEQIPKMRINLMQQFSTRKIPVFEGGRPGMRLKLQHAGLLSFFFHKSLLISS
uniref:UDENN domain-containing protein n=1 Tax=Gongylonema pulchrum TaxID=637853 RepID=A0A183ESM2_9BILA